MTYNTFSIVKRARYVGEFFGTLFLVCIIKLGLTMQSDKTGTGTFPAFPIGFGLICLVYQFGYISSAHFNPAVTIAVIIRGNVSSFPSNDFGQIIMYFTCEILGGICGGWIGQLIAGHSACDSFPLINRSDYTLINAFFAEFVFTFLLVSVILHVGTHQSGNQFYGLAIGLTVFTSILCIGPITGCVINPAVYIGLIFSSYTCGKTTDDLQLKYIYIYLLSELLGCIFSAILFRFIFIPANEISEFPECINMECLLDLQNEKENDDPNCQPPKKKSTLDKIRNVIGGAHDHEEKTSLTQDTYARYHNGSDPTVHAGTHGGAADISGYDNDHVHIGTHSSPKIGIGINKSMASGIDQVPSSSGTNVSTLSHRQVQNDNYN